MSEKLYYAAAASFEAARKVRELPQGHRAAQLHGHSFTAKVRAELPANWASFDGAEVDHLQSILAAAVAPLDYAYLNDCIDVPTDENTARWLYQSIALENIRSIGIQSTSEQGADIDQNDHVHLWRRYRFEAAHKLPNVPAGHQCGRMHGHGFEVILHVDQNIGNEDMGMDFDSIDRHWAPLQAQLDHSCLNDIDGLSNPTSEMIADWIWQRVKPAIQALSWVTVYETRSSGCHFDGSSYRIWKQQSFESAVQIGTAPEGDLRRQLHGHSYLSRLHLTAELDEVMGWTVDYGDVKEVFGPIYRQLDHHRVNQLPDIEGGDVASVLRWIKNNMGDLLPQLDRIDLYQTPGCGAVLTWGGQGPALPV